MNKLLVHGQGVVIFNTDSSTVTFTIMASNYLDGMNIYFSSQNVYASKIQNGKTFTDKFIDPSNNKGIITNKGAYYWFSLDSQNQLLYAGIGEPRIENKIYEYRFDITEKSKKEKTKKYLESLIYITKDDTLKIINILKYPILPNKIPLIVKSINNLTMMDIAKQTYIPLENLSFVSQKLYNSIGGKRFILNDDDFPDFSKAIEYSIETEGCWCNTKIKEKSKEFNPQHPNILETYVRITMGVNNGDSPGQMLVMEIWPKGGHYSPIHSHANCHAIIRVLHGSINVSLYPYLCGDKEEIEPFAIQDFYEGDVTWISPTLNQVHKLCNKSNETTCITIQCYEYDENDIKHYDYFDYIDYNGKIKKYEPDSDCDFVIFREIMKTEWENKQVII